MTKFLLAVFVCFFIQKSTAQKTAFEFKPDFDKQVYSTYPITNNKDNELVILFDTKNKYHVFVFDSNFEEISKINFERLPKKINEFIGYTIQGENYDIVFKNPSSTKFAVVSINFKEKTSNQEIIDFSLKSQKLLDVFSFKNKLHLVSTKVDSRSFNIYVYEDGLFKQHSISVNGKDDENPYLDTSYSLLIDQKLANTGDNMKVIDNKIPNSVFDSNIKAKLYVKDESFTITFDKENDITRMITINPENFDVKRRIFHHAKNMTAKIRNSNSYIYENKLFQVASSSEFLKVTITDLDTNKIIKEYFGNNLQDIYFKNGDVNQHKTDLLGGSKKLNTSKQFLRKISKGMQGISVYKFMDHYKLSIGSKKPVTFSGGSGFTPNYNGSGAPVMQYNPALKSDSDQKTVWIDCIFDKDLNHKKGEVKDFIPAHILNFVKNGIMNKKSIFTFQDKMYRGTFIPSLNTYRINLLLL